MGILFDESASNYLQFTDDAKLTLDTGDWCIAFWESTTDNSGSSFQYIYSSGPVSGNNSINIYFAEASASGDQNELRVWAVAGGPLTLANISNGSALTFDGTPRLWVIQRVGSSGIKVRMCPAYGEVTSYSSYAHVSATATINPADTEIGRRSDGNSARAYGGTIGHFFKGQFSLTNAEITAIGSGAFPWELGHTPDVYLPMTSNVASPPDILGGLTVTRNGTLADGVAFPQDMRGFMSSMIYTPVGGGTTLTADPGSFTLTGQAVELTKGSTLIANHGSFSLTGQAADLIMTVNLDAAQGAFTLTGQQAEFLRSLSLIAGQGSFALTGQAAELTKGGMALEADQGSFALTGNAAGLLHSLTMAAGQGSFALTGQAAELTKGGTALDADPGYFTLTGNAAGLLEALILEAGQGAFTLTGNDAALSQAREIVAETGQFYLTGYDSAMIAARELAAGHGVFTLTGNGVTFLYSGDAPPTLGYSGLLVIDDRPGLIALDDNPGLIRIH